MQLPSPTCIFFFFNDTATTEIYTLSLHDALPILQNWMLDQTIFIPLVRNVFTVAAGPRLANPKIEDIIGSIPQYIWIDRKSTRLNSSHSQISYAVFCLKKKKTRSYHILRASIHMQ